MTFSESIATCFSKYATFSGRASRSEYWWFALFCFLIQVLGSIDEKLKLGMELVFAIGYLAVLIPWLAVASRRLHDINKSGWWQLLYLTIIGAFVLLYWFSKDSDHAVNEYGALPQ
jgi:uncharacterized membrane protein YhaH (DUF805 family)